MCYVFALIVFMNTGCCEAEGLSVHATYLLFSACCLSARWGVVTHVNLSRPFDYRLAQLSLSNRFCRIAVPMSFLCQWPGAANPVSRSLLAYSRSPIQSQHATQKRVQCLTHMLYILTEGTGILCSSSRRSQARTFLFQECSCRCLLGFPAVL